MWGIFHFAEIDFLVVVFLFFLSACVIFFCISYTGMFKYPQHMARETRGEMEPTDLKLFTGEVEIHHDSHLSEWISRAVVRVFVLQAIVYHCPVITLPGALY